jgi:DNA-binding LacI/PurR family transcriptional regulator
VFRTPGNDATLEATMPFPDPLTTSNKVDALAEQLRRIAFERGPDAQMPTAREIRDALGVGMSTVAGALQNLEDQNVIYRKHGVGIFVSPHLHRRTVAILMDGSFFLHPGLSPFWGLLWGFLQSEARKRSQPRGEDFTFHLITGEAGGGLPLPDLLARGILAGQVHAVVGIGLETAVTRWLHQRGIPHVVFAAYGDATVRLDGTAVVREGVYALAEQGCRRIALWRPVTPFRATSLEYMVHPEEIGAFTEALHQKGLPLVPRQVRQTLHLIAGEDQQTTLTHQEQGYLLATEVFTDPDGDPARPDGIVLTDDMMTWGVVAALNRLGVAVGGDVKIATHANRGSRVLFGYEDVLTRIEADPEAVVTTLFDLLDGLQDGTVARGTVVDLEPRRAD